MSLIKKIKPNHIIRYLGIYFDKIVQKNIDRKVTKYLESNGLTDLINIGLLDWILEKESNK